MNSLMHYTRAGWTVCYLHRTESTNDVVLAAGQRGMPENLVVIAGEQTAGRGRLDRRWLAPPESCLLMSLLFYPPPPFERTAGRVTMACGLALREAIAMTTGLPVTLKWPNDVIVSDAQGSWRKLAGMLSEIGLEGGIPRFVVVGIGLNVNVPAPVLPELSPRATSLLVEIGRPVDRVVLLDAFLSQVESFYRSVCQGEDLLSRWRAHLAWMGQPVQLQTPTAVVRGIAEDVDDDGSLWVRLPSGVRSRFAVGDVTLRRA